jgi:hypothetical protein
MTEPTQPQAATAHARHDRDLIAALAAREPDIAAPELGAARELAQRCTECRDLLADLVALQTAVPTMATPPRPRDFTLTDADARRLRPRGWRAALGFIGSARDGFSRPLAVGFTTIGMVALLVTALPSIPLGGSGGGMVLSTVGNAVPQAAPGAAASQAPASSAPSAAPAPAAQPAASASTALEYAASAAASEPASATYDRMNARSAEPYGTAGQRESVFSGEDEGSTDQLIGDTNVLSVRDEGGLSLGIVIAGICLIIGLGLFALRWTSRRFGDG